jgi:hypothetical protein
LPAGSLKQISFRWIPDKRIGRIGLTSRSSAYGNSLAG